MPGRYEVTKTIEAEKLSSRTLRVLNVPRQTIPYGSVVTQVTKERGNIRFIFLGEPYEAPELDIGTALRKLD